MTKWWWKVLAISLMLFTIVMGMMATVPTLPILHETIRNLYYHVPMWFGMTLMLLVAMIYSIRYLRSGKMEHDILAASFTKVGLLMGCCGITTGMLWAQSTWGVFWNNDPKETAAAVGLLLYFAYFVLRNSMDDMDKRARVSAVANIIFYFTFIPIIFIVPRLTDSLHPGNGGNPGFNAYDLDNNMRKIFYPAVIGWSLLGTWIASVTARIEILNSQLHFSLNNSVTNSSKQLDSKL
ncbi:MAG: cytochrome c biogenesis protein [Bacteroidota bacterium]